MTIPAVNRAPWIGRAADGAMQRSSATGPDHRAGASFERLLRERDERSRSSPPDDDADPQAASPLPPLPPLPSLPPRDPGVLAAADAADRIRLAGTAYSVDDGGAIDAAAAAAAAGTARQATALAAPTPEPASGTSAIGIAASPTQAALELALTLAPPAVDSASPGRWSIAIGLGSAAPLTLTATRVAGDAAGAPSAWALRLQPGRGDRVAGARHAARLEDRLWAQAIPARVTVARDDEDGQ